MHPDLRVEIELVHNIQIVRVSQGLVAAGVVDYMILKCPIMMAQPE
jgi:hypothetical protein